MSNYFCINFMDLLQINSYLFSFLSSEKLVVPTDTLHSERTGPCGDETVDAYTGQCDDDIDTE